MTNGVYEARRREASPARRRRAMSFPGWCPPVDTSSSSLSIDASSGSSRRSSTPIRRSARRFMGPMRIVCHLCEAGQSISRDDIDSQNGGGESWLLVVPESLRGSVTRRPGCPSSSRAPGRRATRAATNNIVARCSPLAMPGGLPKSRLKRVAGLSRIPPGAGLLVCVGEPSSSIRTGAARGRTHR